jgi:hypothetical protein
MTKRYKISKEQLERVVENFVMEAATASKKTPVKDHIPTQGKEVKKHVKNKISGDMVELSDGIHTTEKLKIKHSQAPEVKKHMSKPGSKLTKKAKVVKEEEEPELLDEGVMDILPSIMEFLKSIDASQSITIGTQPVPMKDFVVGVLISLGVPIGALVSIFGKEIKEKTYEKYKNISAKFGKGVEAIKKFIDYVKEKVGKE